VAGGEDRGERGVSGARGCSHLDGTK